MSKSPPQYLPIIERVAEQSAEVYADQADESALADIVEAAKTAAHNYIWSVGETEALLAELVGHADEGARRAFISRKVRS